MILEFKTTDEYFNLKNYICLRDLKAKCATTFMKNIQF